MAGHPIFPLDNAKVRKNHVVCKLNRKKDTKKDTFRKYCLFSPHFSRFSSSPPLRVASLQLKFPPSQIWKIYPIYLYIFIYIIYRRIFGLGIGIKINCNIATSQHQVSTISVYFVVDKMMKCFFLCHFEKNIWCFRLVFVFLHRKTD